MGRQSVLWIVAVVTVSLHTGVRANVIGDEFFFSVGRPPGFIGPQAAVFGDGQTYIVGLDVFFQLTITADPADPLLAVPLMRISAEAGQIRDHALVIDFTGLTDNLPPGYPLDLIGNTVIWFDDLESVDVFTESPPTRIGRLVVTRSSAASDEVEQGNPLRLIDGTGVTLPAPSDDIFDFNQTRLPNFNGFGEGMVFTLVDWTTVITHPVIRIEFDMIPSLLGDVDRDGDVDLADYVRAQSLFTGAGIGDGVKRNDADLDADGDVDLADLLGLLNAYTGPTGR